MSLVERWRRWARDFEDDVHAVYLAAGDPRVPWYAKALALAVAAYAFSPIDLIPDVIPLLGYLDDLILLPLGIALVIRLVPGGVWAECRARAGERVRDRRLGRIAAAVVVLLWIAVAVWVGHWLAAGAADVREPARSGQLIRSVSTTTNPMRSMVAMAVPRAW